MINIGYMIMFVLFDYISGFRNIGFQFVLEVIYIINSLNILTIVHKSSIEKVKEEDLKKGLEKIKGFIYLYLVFFIFSCIFLFWTKWPPCLFFMFLPFVGVFSPVGKKFKEGFVLIRFKEFYFLLLFSCIFSIFVFMLFKGCSIIYTIEFIMGILCWISFVILYFRNCWLKFNDLKPSRISNILMILFILIGIVLVYVLFW